LSQPKSGSVNIFSRPYEWVWERESDHHPEGYFRGKKTTNAGQPLLTDEAESIKVTIRGIDDRMVSFTWDLKNLDNQNAPVKASIRSYISNSYSGTITVIDHDAQTAVETIAVADRTSHGIAAHPDGKYIYVGDYEGGNIYVISTNDFEVIETIDVGSNAHGVDIDPSGKYLYVSGGSVNTRGDVVVVDINSYDVVKGIETEGAGHIHFGPDGKYAYVSNVDLNQIAVIDTEAMELLTTVPVGAGPNEAVASPDGAFVYSANVNDDSVSVIKVGRWEEVERIPAGEGTHGIDISPDGKYVWTANRNSNDVTVIDTDARKVIATIAEGEDANHLAITPDGSAVYVTAVRSGEVLIVDSRTFDLIGRIPVGEEPHEIAFTMDA
jgi:YVTN family beta-propeller protein